MRRRRAGLAITISHYRGDEEANIAPEDQHMAVLELNTMNDEDVEESFKGYWVNATGQLFSAIVESLYPSYISRCQTLPNSSTQTGRSCWPLTTSVATASRATSTPKSSFPTTSGLSNPLL